MTRSALAAWVVVAAGANAETTKLASKVAELPFSSTEPPAAQMTIGVGVYFEHLFAINSNAHTFKADFWLVYSWHDPRNFSALFFDNPLVETEETNCNASEEAHPRGRRVHGAEGGGPRRFLEFDNSVDGSTDLLWQPDLHVRNIRQQQDDIVHHATMTRVYDDGTVEHMQLVYGELVRGPRHESGAHGLCGPSPVGQQRSVRPQELENPYYGNYPFDHQKLTVQIESFAHSTKQIEVTALERFSGLNYDVIDDWPGWVPVESGVYFKIDSVAPHYAVAPGHEQRCERRSRYHLDVFVQREIKNLVQDSLMPLLLQVVITWTAFFISIKQLMPRVAVAFMHAAAPQHPKFAPFAHPCCPMIAKKLRSAACAQLLPHVEQLRVRDGRAAARRQLPVVAEPLHPLAASDGGRRPL